MPKLIGSVSHRLYVVECENDDLKKQIRDMAAELLEWKTYVKRLNLPGPRKEESRPSAALPRNDRGFLRATKASEIRAIRPSEQGTKVSSPTWPTTFLYGSQYSSPCRMQFRDEVAGPVPVAEIQSWGGPNFCRSTRSSDQKALPNRRWAHYSWSDEDSELQSGSSSSGQPSTEEDLYVEPQEEEMEQPSEEIADEDQTLAEQTGLRVYIPNQLRDVPISSKKKFGVLARGLRLAQEIIYHNAKTHIPCLMKLWSGPQEVTFGRDELLNRVLPCVGSGNKIEEVNGRRIDYRELEGLLLEITPLRNLICHYNPRTASMRIHNCDAYLIDVLALAIFFNDRPRAFRARALRLQLVAWAENSIKEIENQLLLTAMPGARPWERYQISAFRSVAEQVRSYPDDSSLCREFHPALLRAAREWDLRQSQPGDDTWNPEEILY
ncbi:hypothetical protein F5Y04DRAFT_285459 [Hypomontagnella monticulosa]|nr:hypothetical protein F5Y04DRAFT_285459 [Hypomontagnella monticulosa]